MYVVRDPTYSKHDPQKRWVLPDRIFFACGACHILAEAFLDRFGEEGLRLLWIRPKAGFWGNHIFVMGEDSVSGRRWVFDYHGFSDAEAFLAHNWRRARTLWPGWDGDLIEIPRAVLTSEAKSREIPGLWLREPAQFLHDAGPRAAAFLHRLLGARCRAGEAALWPSARQ